MFKNAPKSKRNINEINKAKNKRRNYKKTEGNF